MIEDKSCEMAAYRRTMYLIHRWDLPEGVEMVVVCYPKWPKINVLLSCQGIEVDASNLEFADSRTASEMLDFLAKCLADRVSEAYRDKRASFGPECRLSYLLDEAAEDFRAGMPAHVSEKKKRGA